MICRCLKTPWPGIPVLSFLALYALALLVSSYAYAGSETLGAAPRGQQELRTLVNRASEMEEEAEAKRAEATEDVEMDQTAGRPAIGILGHLESEDSEAALLRSKSGLDALNAQQRTQWKATFSRKNGQVRLLHDGVSKAYPDGPEAVARGFLRDAHQVLGVREDLSNLRTVRVNETPERNHVRMQQLHNGIPVANSYMVVHANKRGEVTMVQNSLVDSLQPSNQSTLPEETAKEIAQKDLQADLPEGGAIGTVSAQQEIMKFQDKYLYVWKVSLPTRQPFGQWMYHVDAENGEILYKGNQRRSVRNGVGRVYTTNKDWHTSKIRSATLKYMYTCLETADCGYLFGQHSDVYDYYGNDPRNSTTFSFMYYPEVYSDDKSSFDATNAYYRLTGLWDWWNSNIINKFSINNIENFKSFRPTVWVNSTDYYDQCNAAYWYDSFTEYTMAFGNEDTCVAGSEDLALDADVAAHEYAHAMMDWLGYVDQFGGAVDHYGRAMGEGNSDWFAYLYTKDPHIGDVAWAWDPVGYLRDLDNTRMYPYDVNLYSSALQTPEEHYTGEIWGAYLHDLSRVLRISAMGYVFKSFNYFDVSGGHVDGEADFFDGVWAQVAAEWDLTGRLNNTAKAWGAIASRGLNSWLRAPYHHDTNYFFTNTSGSDRPSAFFLNFPPMKTIKTKGNILISGDYHEYVIHPTQAGLDLTVTVTPDRRAGPIRDPSITLYDATGTVLPGGTTSRAGVAKTTLKVFDLPYTTGADADNILVVVVSGNATAPTRGHYDLTVSVTGGTSTVGAGPVGAAQAISGH